MGKKQILAKIGCLGLAFLVLVGVIIATLRVAFFAGFGMDTVAPAVSDKATTEFTMEPEECFPGEKYDEVEKFCYIDCNSEDECARIEQQILDNLEGVGDDFQSGQDQFQDEYNSETGLITYEVAGDKLINPVRNNVGGKLKKWQQDKEKHLEIWNTFVNLFPSQMREDVSSFVIFSDGRDGSFAAVFQDEENPFKWVLGIDIIDAYPDKEKIDRSDFKYSLIHEFGHLLTLSSDQIEVDIKLFNAQTDEKYEERLFIGRSTCKPRYFTGEGCSYPNSYINKFTSAFWFDKLAELEKIEAIAADERYEEEFDKFYRRYKEEFVTDYAASNPGEDIAETWAAFVLQEEPTGTSVVDQKILFFYQFPELVNLRKLIRLRIQ